jgi:hypothetical protein
MESGSLVNKVERMRVHCALKVKVKFQVQQDLSSKLKIQLHMYSVLNYRKIW